MLGNAVRKREPSGKNREGKSPDKPPRSRNEPGEIAIGPAPGLTTDKKGRKPNRPTKNRNHKILRRHLSNPRVTYFGDPNGAWLDKKYPNEISNNMI